MTIPLYNSFLTTSTSENYPRYNIVKTDEGTLLEVSVPGRAREDVEVTVADGALKITCAKLPETEGRTYVTKGISGKAFKKSFVLSKTSEVKYAKLNNGLLSVLVVDSQSSPFRIEIEE